MGKKDIRVDNDLLCCPFCGCEDIETIWHNAHGDELDYVAMGCFDCGAQGPAISQEDAFSGKESGEAKWNQRAFLRKK